MAPRFPKGCGFYTLFFQMSGRPLKCFAVEGVGIFPFDLLRRDRCWPATAEDARLIGLHPASGDTDAQRTRYVRLETARASAPSRTRWRQRGWPVID